MESKKLTDSDISYIIGQYRNPYESTREWEMRRDFMIANYGKVSLESLVCLANCYVNIEMYGCRYPLLVMGQINEMSDNLQIHKKNIEQLPSRMKGLETVKFVKSSVSEREEVPNHKVNKTTQNDSLDNKTVQSNQKEMSQLSAKKQATKVNFVKASSEYQSTDIAIVATEHPKQKSRRDEFMSSCEPQPVIHQHVSVKNSQKKTGLGFETKPKSTQLPNINPEKHTANNEIDVQFHEFKHHFTTYRKAHAQRLPVDIFHMVGMKTKMKINTKFTDMSEKGQHKFACTIYLDNIEIATGVDSNKKGAKNNAFLLAQEKFMKRYLKVVRINPEKQELHASDTEHAPGDNNLAKMEDEGNEEKSNPSRKRKLSELHGDLTRFIIFEAADPPDTQNPSMVLQNSANINHANLTYDFHEDSTGVRCRVVLEGHTLVEYMGTTKASSKTTASEKALERLRQICYTIKTKQAVDSSESSVSRDEVMGDIQKQVAEISDDNIGSRLLRKMGWSGGGVGAEGNKGKAEPVAVSMANHTVLRREGLGLHSDHAKAMVDFKRKITEVVESYAKSEKQEDLAFAPEFSKEERAFIHQYCQKLGLKTQSRGSGNERYLTVSRRRSAAQLFDHILEEGGSTQKYELVAPLYDS